MVRGTLVASILWWPKGSMLMERSNERGTGQHARQRALPWHTLAGGVGPVQELVR
jgi:hypothetical protein